MSKTLNDEKNFSAEQGNILSTQLKALYKSQDTLQKLIDDESIPTQKMDEYYVDLQMILDDQDNNEKLPIEVAKKVSLIMNMLAKNKIDRKTDHNISNTAKLIEIIDKITIKNIVMWSGDIIESGYLSKAMKKKLFEIIEQASVQYIATEERIIEQRMRNSLMLAEETYVIELNTALNLLLNFVASLSKQETENLLGDIQELLISNYDYSVKRGCLQIISEIIIHDQTLNPDLKKNIITKIIWLYGDNNLADAVILTLQNIAKYNGVDSIFHILHSIIALQGVDSYQNLKEPVIILITNILKMIDENDHVKNNLNDVPSSLLNLLENIGKANHNVDLAKAILSFLYLLQNVEDLRYDAVTAISRVSKTNNDLSIIEKSISELAHLLDNKEDYIINTAVTAVGKIAKASNNTIGFCRKFLEYML